MEKTPLALLDEKEHCFTSFNLVCSHLHLLRDWSLHRWRSLVDLFCALLSCFERCLRLLCRKTFWKASSNRIKPKQDFRGLYRRSFFEYFQCLYLFVSLPVRKFLAMSTKQAWLWSFRRFHMRHVLNAFVSDPNLATTLYLYGLWLVLDFTCHNLYNDDSRFCIAVCPIYRLYGLWLQKVCQSEGLCDNFAWSWGTYRPYGLHQHYGLLLSLFIVPIHTQRPNRGRGSLQLSQIAWLRSAGRYC